ncbi:MAG: hypothetical protein ACRDRJ_49700, partial [Streptosporangiaceae bacterium]
AQGWRDLAAGRVATAFAVVAPVAVPAGLGIAGALWARRIWAIETGLDGRTATAPVTFDAGQWRRQARTARGRLAVPATVPLLDRKGRIVMGATIRAIGHRWQPLLTISPAAMSRHQVIIGTSGAGKTNLMIRSWAGWHAAARRAWLERGAARPLLAVLDCKGGPDARLKAQRTRRTLHGTGAARVAVWPDDTGISLWALPPQVLTVALFQMIDTGTRPAAYYADLTQATLSLAIHAPGGPPNSRLDFLDRLDPAWLTAAWTGHPRELAAITAARAHLGDIALRYRTLLERLGPGLDGPGHPRRRRRRRLVLHPGRHPRADRRRSAGLAITELIAHTATSQGTEPRAILLACDDYSAISRRVPLWQLYERGRSLGVAVQVSAQSWQGLAPDEDERYRIAATADGGIWLMRTPYPEPLSQLAGTRRIVETATKMLAGMWGDEGSSRVQHAFTADPGIARALATGQAGYIHAGGCTWTQIARPRPSPRPLPRPAPPPARVIIPAEPAQTAQPRPGGTGPVPAGITTSPDRLDDVFGQEARR